MQGVDADGERAAGAVSVEFFAALNDDCEGFLFPDSGCIRSKAPQLRVLIHRQIMLQGPERLLSLLD